MIFFDSYAIIEVINGNQKYEKYSEETIITTALDLSEVTYSLLKEFDEGRVKEIIDKLNLELIDMDKDTAIESAIFRYQNRKKKMSYADCIGYILAQKNKIMFLTGDKEFKGLRNVEFVSS